MNFLEQKSKQLAREDKSNEGKIDKEISGLCRKINAKKGYYTTSSCSGRISLIKALNEKSEGVFLFKTHDKITFKKLKSELKKASKYKELIYFKQEPCILHVACLNVDQGNKLLIRARIAGWKRSGMIATSKRIILELMSTEKIELPIIFNGEILVSDEYIKLLVEEANKKLEKVKEKIKKFESLI